MDLNISDVQQNWDAAGVFASAKWNSWISAAGEKLKDRDNGFLEHSLVRCAIKATASNNVHWETAEAAKQTSS